MKILFCSPNKVTQELGAPRVLLGVAEALRRRGWEYRIVDQQETARAVGMEGAPFTEYPEMLRIYLQRHAKDYDVVEFDNHHLPFPRKHFVESTLFVARSVLMMDHLLEVSPPTLSRFPQDVKRWLFRDKHRKRNQIQTWVNNGHITAANADLINVANTDDSIALRKAGIDPLKVCIVPYGLGKEELQTLGKLNTNNVPQMRICFLGTFDERKGGADLIKIFSMIMRDFPECKLRLIGTAGQYQSSKEVALFFPKKLRSSVEIIPRFTRAELPQLLEGCAVGLFPSYVEGFGFSILEMMASGIPVCAYRAPGPPMMLTDDLLVARGDISALAEKISALLQDGDARDTLKCFSRQRAKEFTWNRAGVITDDAYREAIRLLNSKQCCAN